MIACAVRIHIVALLSVLTLGMHGTVSRAAQCSVTIGVVLELTGPAGDYGQAAAKSIELAFRDLNAAGGVRGCSLVADIKDSQSQSTAAVDAANQLVRLDKVPVIIGGVLSSVTIPMLTAVTGPARILQISPGATSPRLTALGREGKSGGMFFRTITSDALQGSVAAKFALEHGMHRMAVIYVNNDYGVDLYDEFARVYKRLGGVIVSATRYNERQSSYASEVTAAMSSGIDGLYLISTPVDGSTIARAWISLGGPRRFLLNDGMNSADFIQGVGAKYLNEAYGTSSGSNATASTAAFEQEYKAFARMDPGSPAADRAYDAAALVGLALAAAPHAEPEAIRAGLFAVTDPAGTAIHIGADEFARALTLLRAGKRIRYEGVIGPVSFDAYGDITGPFRLWRITDGVVTTVGQMTVEEVNALLTQVGR